MRTSADNGTSVFRFLERAVTDPTDVLNTVQSSAFDRSLAGCLEQFFLKEFKRGALHRADALGEPIRQGEKHILRIVSVNLRRDFRNGDFVALFFEAEANRLNIRPIFFECKDLSFRHGDLDRDEEKLSVLRSSAQMCTKPVENDSFVRGVLINENETVIELNDDVRVVRLTYNDVIGDIRLFGNIFYCGFCHRRL